MVSVDSVEIERTEGHVARIDQLEHAIDGFVRSAKRLLDARPVSPRTRVGCVLGTATGTLAVPETILEAVGNGTESSLDPGAFLLFSPHGVTSRLCLELSIGGECGTLLGPRAGLDALSHAHRLLALGVVDVVICGVFEWPTPFGRACVDSANGELPDRWSGHVLVTMSSDSDGPLDPLRRSTGRVGSKGEWPTAESLSGGFGSIGPMVAVLRELANGRAIDRRALFAARSDVDE